MCSLRILIRRSLDWDNASYDDLLNPSIRRVAELWDRSFALSYIACRARIKWITRIYLQAVPNVRIEEAHDIGLSGVLEQQPPLPVEEMFSPDDLVLISDDDDIYHPGILEVLQDAPWRDYILALVQQYVDFNNIREQQGLEWCADYISLVQDVFREALGRGS